MIMCQRVQATLPYCDLFNWIDKFRLNGQVDFETFFLK